MVKWILMDENYGDCSNRECEGEGTVSFYEKDEKKGITHKYVCSKCGEISIRPQTIGE